MAYANDVSNGNSTTQIFSSAFFYIPGEEAMKGGTQWRNPIRLGLVVIPVRHTLRQLRNHSRSRRMAIVWYTFVSDRREIILSEPTRVSSFSQPSVPSYWDIGREGTECNQTPRRTRKRGVILIQLGG